MGFFSNLRVARRQPAFDSAIENDWYETLIAAGACRRDNEEMVSTLCQWWDEWDYSWEKYPGDLRSPRNHANRIKRSLAAWMKANEV
jgi:hypothetical protein